MVKGKQQVHVDNLMSSHEDKMVYIEFSKWLKEKYKKYEAVKGHK